MTVSTAAAVLLGLVLATASGQTQPCTLASPGVAGLASYLELDACSSVEMANA